MTVCIVCVFHASFAQTDMQAGDGGDLDKVRISIPDMEAYEDQTITSLETHAPGFNLKTYPNLIDNQLFIEFTGAETGIPDVYLYNSPGEVVAWLELQRCGRDCWCAHLNAESLPGALYFCRVTFGRFSETEKLLLHR